MCNCSVVGSIYAAAYAVKLLIKNYMQNAPLIVSGLQYAGGHLRELQKAVKAPISNFGVVLGEVTKRGRSVVGLGGTNTLASHVHPNLVDVSANLCKNVELFGGAVEKVLIKHGKKYPLPGPGKN